MELWEYTNYLTEIPFMFNTYIREYDISKANINILFRKKAISEEQYHTLYQSPKDIRQYTIGMMQRNNEKIKETLENGFKECRKMFLEYNQLSNVDILSIKKDAIYVINKKPKYTEFDNIVFLNKNTYTSYMSLAKRRIELYYIRDRINNLEKVDVKGISDEKLKYHDNYFLDFIYYFFDIIQNENIESLISSFQTFYKNYVERQLEIGYYRPFNEVSSFVLDWKDDLNPTKKYMIDSLNMANKYRENIDISYNANLLREMYQYLSYIYFSSHK